MKPLWQDEKLAQWCLGEDVGVVEISAENINGNTIPDFDFMADAWNPSFSRMPTICCSSTPASHAVGINIMGQVRKVSRKSRIQYRSRILPIREPIMTRSLQGLPQSRDRRRQRHAGARRTIRRRHRLGPRQHWCRPTSNGGGYPLLLPDFDRRVGPVNGGA